ncbi:hypothetical protein EDL99_11455, partial [Ornithobacterium rhinotracheale]
DELLLWMQQLQKGDINIFHHEDIQWTEIGEVAYRDLRARDAFGLDWAYRGGKTARPDNYEDLKGFSYRG